MATVGYDDEAVPGQSWHLVKDGLFVDWQTTRDTAKLVGKSKSYGCLHADSWGSVPFPRMPNVSLQPAKESVSQDDLIAGVENGILIYGRGSYSIDQQRYNFQFGGQTFWEIKAARSRACFAMLHTKPERLIFGDRSTPWAVRKHTRYRDHRTMVKANRANRTRSHTAARRPVLGISQS
jgi:hypothetical protein